MIHNFTVENFQSVNGKVRIDFGVDEKTPDSSRYFRAPSGAKLSLVTALIGPNAVGKTTALRALSFVRWLIVNSFFMSRYEDEMPFNQFAGNKGKRVPTTLSVEFEIKGDVYTYRVVLTKTRVIEEELSVKSRVTERITTKKLFLRKWSGREKAYTVDDYGFGLPDGYWRSKELQLTSLIAAAGKFGHEHASNITEYWRNVQTNIEETRYFRPAGYEMYEALRYFDRDQEIRKSAENDARQYADLGISSFNSGKIRHKYGSLEYDLDPDEESSGTRNYIGLSKMLSVVLNKGGIAIVDEFDAYLHFNMFQSLLNKFFDPKKNTGGGQLLMTTHNLGVFSLVDPKHQIILTEKDKLGATKVHAIKGRADANHLQKYLSNQYGALPTILDEI